MKKIHPCLRLESQMPTAPAPTTSSRGIHVRQSGGSATMTESVAESSAAEEDDRLTPAASAWTESALELADSPARSRRGPEAEVSMEGLWMTTPPGVTMLSAVSRSVVESAPHDSSNLRQSIEPETAVTAPESRVSDIDETVEAAVLFVRQEENANASARTTISDRMVEIQNPARERSQSGRPIGSGDIDQLPAAAGTGK